MVLINSLKKDINIKYKIKNKKVISFLKNIKFNKSIKLNNKCIKINGKILSELYNIKKIPDYLRSNIKRDCIYKNMYETENINITIYSKNKNNDILIKKISSIINMFKLLSNQKEYVIEILLLKDKKIIHEGYNYITNFNSGVNTFNKIFLFREEEVIKVLIHELIHNTNSDIWLLGHKLDYLYKNINIKWIKNIGTNNQYPNEAYTECLCIIYLAIWKYHYFGFTKDIIKYMEKELLEQNLFTMNQIAKICKLQGYSSYSDLFKKEFVQENRVLSYFIVKNHMLINPKFLKCLLI